MTSIKLDLHASVILLVVLWSCIAKAQLTETKLHASDGRALDGFGSSVSISGDNALIGVSGDNIQTSDEGSAYFYRFDGSAWIQKARLTASDGETGDKFGSSVSLNGDYALVGAYLDDNENGTDAGSAYVFHYNGLTWVQEAKLTANHGSIGDQFGNAVSINGSFALIAAQFNDANGLNAGTAYIFYYDGTTWTEQAALFPDEGDAGDDFGSSVSISGDRALVGAMNEDDGGTITGAAYTFHNEGSYWVEEARLTARNGEVSGFGHSVSLGGDFAAVGAFLDTNENGLFAGAAYVFHFNGSNWVQQSKLTAGDGAPSDMFGDCVSLIGDYLLVSANFDDNANGVDAGAAYIFHFNELAWTEREKIVASDGNFTDQFGYGASLSDEHALISAPLNDAQSFDDGAAYVYDGFAVPPSPLAVIIEIDSSTVPVPPEGGDVSFVFRVTNETPDQVSALISCGMADPRGAIHPVFSDYPLVLEGFDSHQMDRIVAIPGGGSAGMYTLAITWNINDEEYGVSTTFEKLPAVIAKGVHEELQTQPNGILLLSNYPNPFNPTTNIAYSIGETGPVKLTVHNTLGQLVATLVNNPSHPAGQFAARFDASGLASGVYLYRLETAGATEAKRMLLVK